MGAFSLLDDIYQDNVRDYFYLLIGVLFCNSVSLCFRMKLLV